ASARRLIAQLGPQRRLVALAIVFAVASVAFAVSGPRILGRATDIIFRGFFGRRLPAGESLAHVVAGLRARGDTPTAGMYEHYQVEPGHGVDLGALADVLTLVLVIYLCSALFAWLQGYVLNFAVQRTMRRLRGEVEAKLMRVPLAYFDGQPHGEILSRVTN